ncbi:MAG: MotA/TolQ/ExbB proton channel family protein [Alphaproteobacteria bacterium]
MTQLAQQTQAFANSDACHDRVRLVPKAGDQRDAAGAPAAQDAAAHRYLLVLRFAVFNLAALALLGAAYLQGWLDVIVEADGTRLSIAIFAVFLGGLAVCARKVWRISVELDCVRNFNPCRQSWAANYLAEVAGRGSGSRAITGSALRARLARRIAVVRHVANSLVLLGLIGTVLGFIIALSGVDPNAAGDVRAVAPMVTNLIGGMSVALYTTLVGAVLNLWLMVNYHMLASGAVKLVTALVALGEANARPQHD